MVGTIRTPRDRWVEQGLQTLAASGVDAVRVESLAKDLGVTKGGFYGYFADRAALLEAMLDTWEREAVDEVLATIDREGSDPRQRATRAGVLTFSDDRLLPIDLAVRAWARRDDAVAQRLRRVDNRRMELLRETIGQGYSDPIEVEARSLLAFCAAIGQHFLAADLVAGSRAEVSARVGAVLFDGPPVSSDAADDGSAPPSA